MKSLSQRLKELGYTSYRQYLKSSHWKSVKKRYYKSNRVIRDIENRVQCSRCMRVKRLDLHHLTYKNLGHERISDLIALCRECHEFLHYEEIMNRVRKKPTKRKRR